MFNTITTCRLSHYFRLKTCSSFLSHSQVFHLMFVIKYVTVLSGKYPANFTRIPDSAGCLHFTGYRIVLSGSGTSLIAGGIDSTIFKAHSTRAASTSAAAKKHLPLDDILKNG